MKRSNKAHLGRSLFLVAIILVIAGFAGMFVALSSGVSDPTPIILLMAGVILGYVVIVKFNDVML